MNILAAQHQQMMMMMKAPQHSPPDHPFAYSATSYNDGKALVGRCGTMPPALQRQQQQQLWPPTTPAINGTMGGNSTGQSAATVKPVFQANHHASTAFFSGDLAFLGSLPINGVPPPVLSNDFYAPGAAAAPHPPPPMTTPSFPTSFAMTPSQPNPLPPTPNKNVTFAAMFDYVERNPRGGQAAESTQNHSAQDFNDMLSHLLGSSDELFDDDMSAGDLSDFCDAMDGEGAAAMMGGPLQVADDGMLLPY